MPTTKQSGKNKNLFELLGELKDHRRTQGRRHSLQVVLLITIMAIMSGAKGERAVARFAANNKKELIKLLKIPKKRIPSRSVIAGAMQKVQFSELEKIFHSWSLQLVSIERGEWLNMDGKAIGGTVHKAHSKQQSFQSLVTVFASKRKQALMAGVINNKKESEIPKVRELIKLLDLQDITFTLDALHCQGETTDVISKTKNNYVIGVKGNQSKLYDQLKKTPKKEKP